MERKVPETQNGSTGSWDVLAEILRQGARDMPAKAIENEVAEYTGELLSNVVDGVFLSVGSMGNVQ